jgi:hypothetical protein
VELQRGASMSHPYWTGVPAGKLPVMYSSILARFSACNLLIIKLCFFSGPRRNRDEAPNRSRLNSVGVPRNRSSDRISRVFGAFLQCPAWWECESVVGAGPKFNRVDIRSNRGLAPEPVSRSAWGRLEDMERKRSLDGRVALAVLIQSLIGAKDVNVKISRDIREFEYGQRQSKSQAYWKGSACNRKSEETEWWRS